jgi:hypothetical protein
MDQQASVNKVNSNVFRLCRLEPEISLSQKIRKSGSPGVSTVYFHSLPRFLLYPSLIILGLLSYNFYLPFLYRDMRANKKCQFLA